MLRYEGSSAHGIAPRRNDPGIVENDVTVRTIPSFYSFFFLSDGQSRSHHLSVWFVG